MITGSCGHEVKWDTPSSWIGSWTKDGEKVVEYVVYCSDCVEAAKVEGVYLGPGARRIDDVWKEWTQRVGNVG